MLNVTLPVSWLGRGGGEGSGTLLDGCEGLGEEERPWGSSLSPVLEPLPGPRSRPGLLPIRIWWSLGEVPQHFKVDGVLNIFTPFSVACLMKEEKKPRAV